MTSEVPIKTYTKKELRDLYGVSRTLFSQWITPLTKELKPLGYKPGQRRFTVKQVELIFLRLGNPR